ncbi:MAG: flagellar basal body rod protein FlgC [Rhizobiales bacterium]|nr:flagellar basal body rod protein FlgC [Hyphomicrobiales bacterium]
MADPLKAALAISGSGIEAQTHRMRIVSENIANANSTGNTPGSDPYSRKTITFASVMDRASGVAKVQVSHFGVDRTGYINQYDPSHIAADEKGMVKMPNVDMFMEIADMRETVRTYEANMQATKQAREMISMSIDLMRN